MDKGNKIQEISEEDLNNIYDSHATYSVMDRNMFRIAVNDILNSLPPEKKAKLIWETACKAQMNEVYNHCSGVPSTNGHAIKHWVKTPQFDYRLLSLSPSNEQEKKGGSNENRRT